MNTEVIFKDVERSAWVDGYIAERVAHLERFGRGITRCHVTLAQEQGSKRTGNRYSVMVEVRIPPQHDLAAKKHKDIADMPTQLPALINLAFGAIERQLKKTAALRRHETKEQQSDGQPHGLVEKVFDDGYGFIRALDDDRQFYFHRNSVLHDAFDELTVGTEVRFTPELGEQGPQASSVQVIGKSP